MKNFLHKSYQKIKERLKGKKHLHYNNLSRQWNEVIIDDHEVIKAINNGIINQLPEIPSKRTFFYFAQPKSASLHITKLFSFTFKVKEYWIGFNGGAGEFYFPRAVGALLNKSITISHSHSSANLNIVEFINKFEPNIIIGYRNLADTVVSRRDMLVRNKRANELISQKAVDSFLKMNNEDQLNFVIDLYAADYLNFYSSWLQNKTNKTFFINYDEFVLDQEYVFKRMANFFNLNFNELIFKNSKLKIDNYGGINRNIGIKARSTELLSKENKIALYNLAQKFKIEDENYLGFAIE